MKLLTLASPLLAILTIIANCQGFVFYPAPQRCRPADNHHHRNKKAIKNHHCQHQEEQPCAPAPAAMVQFEQVFYQHPTTNWMRQLVSSEPRRTWALENVTFRWEAELVLLVGASMSGKSTALRLITVAMMTEHQELVPTHGSIHVSAPPIYRDATKLPPDALGKKEHWTVAERLANCPQLLFALGLAESADKTSSQLSVSEQYKLAIAELCLNNAAVTDESPIPPPILLLDEWLDKEPTSIVRAVEEALETFVAATKAVVCVVTHKTDRWRTQNRWELRRGQVVNRPEIRTL
jgi:ABC-type lipoprotein export system ATPase subunit